MADDPPEIYADDEAWWPPGQRVAEDETVDVRCPCGVLWHVHTDLIGSRLRCRCGEWVSVAAPDAAGPVTGLLPESAPLIVESSPVVPAASSRGQSRPQPSEHGALRHASVSAQARWTDRTLIELFLLMMAFIVPSAVLQFGTTGDMRGVFMPLAGLATSLLVFFIALMSRGYAFEGLRRAAPKYFLEALLATGVALALAYAWMALVSAASPMERSDPFAPLKDEIGLGMVIFVVGVVPGIFEEIAFRGLVQGRLSVLFGTRQGLLLAGIAFALAHGVTPALPIHAGLGVYLCWLRWRSNSLLPGMLLHFAYNTTLVVVGAG